MSSDNEAEVTLKRKQDAAEAMYDALKGLVGCVEQFGILCAAETDAARSALDLADGHATISTFDSQE